MRNSIAGFLGALAALATLALQPALAAEESDESSSEPTMADLNAKIVALDADLKALSATIANLATLTGTLATASAVQSLTAKVDNHAGRGEQLAIFMTDPSTNPAGLYHIGESTIPGFPPGPKDSHGRIAQTGGVAGTWRSVLNPATILPAGTYLIELQQPRTDNVACIHSVTQRVGTGNKSFGHLRLPICPSMTLKFSGSARGRLGVLKDGAGIYTTDGTESFTISHGFPAGFTFTTDKPLNGYIGAVKVTKIK